MKLTGGYGRPAPRLRVSAQQADPNAHLKANFRYKVERKRAQEPARRLATLAASGSGDSLAPFAGDNLDPLQNLNAVFAGTPFQRSTRPAQYFGTARPAPRDARAQLQRGKSVIAPLSQLQLTAMLQASAQAADSRAAGQAARFGLQPPPAVHTADFRRKLQTDPSFQQLVNEPDKEQQFSNVAIASAMGLPVGGQAADRYINKAIGIIRSGFNPKDVPGLVLGPENANSIATLQAAVIAQGFSKEEVDKMNPGQLFAAAGRINKYTSWGNFPGGRLLPTMISSFPRSIGQGMLGGPFEAIKGASAALHDIKALPSNIGKGINDPGYQPYQTDDVVAEVGKGLYQFGQGLIRHPIGSLEQDPFNTLLAGWAVAHGGAGVAGKALAAKPFGRMPILPRSDRNVRLFAGRNTGDRLVDATAPVPPGPIIPPGDRPIPPNPVFNPPRALEPAPGGFRVGFPERPSPPAGLPPGPPGADLSGAMGILGRVSERRTRIEHVAAERRAAERRAAEANQPALVESRDAKLARLQKLQDARPAVAARAQEYKDYAQSKRNNRSNLIKMLETQRTDLVKQIDSATPEQLPNLQADLVSLDGHLNRAKNNRNYSGRRDAMEMYAMARTELQQLDANIFQHHLDLNLEHPKAGSQISKARRDLRAAIQAGDTTTATQMRQRIDQMQKLGQPDELAPFKEVTQQMDQQWFDSQGEPLTPIQHALSAFESKWQLEHSHDAGPDAQAHAQTLIDALHELSLPDNSPELPGLHPATDRIAELYHQKFGADANVLDNNVSPEMAKKLQSFLQDAQNAVIKDEAAHHQRHMVNVGVTEGTVTRLPDQPVPTASTVPPPVEPPPGPRPTVRHENMAHIDFAGHALHDANAEISPAEVLADPAAHSGDPKTLTQTMKVAEQQLLDVNGFLESVGTTHDMTLPERAQFGPLIDQHLAAKAELESGIAKIDALLKSHTAEVVAPGRTAAAVDDLEAARYLVRNLEQQKQLISKPPKKVDTGMGKYDITSIRPYRDSSGMFFAQFERDGKLHETLIYSNGKTVSDYPVKETATRIETPSAATMDASIEAARAKVAALEGQGTAIPPKFGPRQGTASEIAAARQPPRFGPHPGDPGQELVPFRERTPLAQEPRNQLAHRRDLSQEPPRMGAHVNIDDSRGLPKAEGGVVKPENYDLKLMKENSVDDLIIHRGRYSSNLIDRMFEWASDKALESSKPMFASYQRGYMQHRYNVKQGHVRRAFYMKRDEFKALIHAAERTTTAELTAVVQAHAQGVRPSLMLRVFQTLLRDSNNDIRRANFPKELKKVLQQRTPSRADLGRVLRILEEDPKYAAHADWLREYMRKAKDQNFFDDHLFGDIITSAWKSSHDLENQVKLWQHIVDDIGDHVTPAMDNVLREMRKASGNIDHMLDVNGILPRAVMDNRRYSRQNLVSSILHEEIPIDAKAIYVPDRSTATRYGDYLFRRSRSYDPGQVFGGRLKANKGRLLVEGKINPGFSSYYTNLTSATSKVDSIRLQHEILKEFAHKVSADQVTYDGERFVLFDGSKGVPDAQIQIRQLMEELNSQLAGPETGQSGLSQTGVPQRIRWRDERYPNMALDESAKRIAARGDLYLVPRPIYDSMIQGVTQAQSKSTFMRGYQKATQVFRRVALSWRPAYFVINTADSGFRAMVFGGVSPLALYRVARMSPEARAALIPLHIKRTTYAGNVQTSMHLGSKAPKFMGAKREKLHDIHVRVQRAPIFGPTLATAKFILGGYGDRVLSGTARAENYLRESVIISKQMKAARHERYSGINPLRYLKGMDDHMQVLMERVAKGQDVTKGNEMNEIVARTAKILGDFSKAERATAQNLMPFYRWSAFILKFVLWESPVHYPGRTLLLQQIGKVGWNNLQQMGLLPQNIQGAFPVGDPHDEHVAATNTTDKILNVMYTQAWNGPSTVLSLFGINAATGEINPFSGAVKSLNPFIQASLAAASLHDMASLRPLQDQNKNDLKHSWTNMGTIFTGQIVRSFWPLMLNYDFSDTTDNSIPIFKEITRPEGKYTQPQSGTVEKLVAAFTGQRSRPIDLTKVQYKNMDDAMTAVKTVYDSLGDGTGVENAAQKHFYTNFLQSFRIQHKYVQDWMDRYGIDPTTVK